MTKTKLSLPEYVYPLGIRYQVQLVDQVDDEESAGETASERRIIKIASNQDTRRRWTTLLHEYLHATISVVGLHGQLSEAVEEVLVQSMEHSLEQFFLAHGVEFLKALEVQK